MSYNNGTITTYIDDSFLKTVTAITSNVQADKVAPHIQTAQKLYIDKLIRPTYADTFKTAIDGQQLLSGVSATNPTEITTETDHGWTTGQRVQIWGNETITAINGGFTITVTGTDTFTLDGVDGTGFPAFIPGKATVMQLSDVLFELLQDIKEPLAFWAFYVSIPFLWMSFKEVGMIKQSGDPDSSTSASQKEMEFFRANIQTTANAFSSPIEHRLKCNPSTYPEWHDDCKLDEVSSKPKTFRKWWGGDARSNRTRGDYPPEWYK